MIDKISSIFSRLLFISSLLLLAVAAWDKIIGYFGWRISGLPYTPSRLLEIAVIFLILIVTLELRQIRELLKK